MSHLGSQISALADGQLAPAAAERAMAHVAACDDCAIELAAARAARRVLSAAFDVPIAPELTRRLLALGTACPPAEARGASPASSRHDLVAAGRGRSSAPLPGSGGARRHPAELDGGLEHRAHNRVVVAAIAGVGVLAAALFVVGDLPTVTPSSHPAHALTVLGRAGDTAAVAPSASGTRGAAASTDDATIQQAILPWTPSAGSSEASADADAASLGMPTVGLDLLGDGSQERVAGWMRDHGWAPLDPLPPGYAITGVRQDARGRSLEVDLDGTAGLIVVTQEHGRLSPAVAARPSGEGGERVHVLSAAPWHCAWQSGDTVVSVVAEVPSEALVTVLESYPATDYDDGVAARIARGWDVLARAWGP
ncbi:MAG: zf-HC2 protein [Actinotalea sp.]|nr:zf-HC2 protein [Actinotalea sp.]